LTVQSPLRPDTSGSASVPCCDLLAPWWAATDEKRDAFARLLFEEVRIKDD
jgi:hypothetical protein